MSAGRRRGTQRRHRGDAGEAHAVERYRRSDGLLAVDALAACEESSGSPALIRAAGAADRARRQNGGGRRRPSFLSG
jgi:hypothetical protein